MIPYIPITTKPIGQLAYISNQPLYHNSANFIAGPRDTIKLLGHGNNFTMQLNKNQQEAFDLVTSGHNVLIHGPIGTRKLTNQR